LYGVADKVLVISDVHDWDGDAVAIEDVDDFSIDLVFFTSVEWNWWEVLMEEVVLLVLHLFICHFMAVVLTVLEIG
jgi:hypothetical protein